MLILFLLTHSMRGRQNLLMWTLSTQPILWLSIQIFACLVSPFMADPAVVLPVMMRGTVAWCHISA